MAVRAEEKAGEQSIVALPSVPNPEFLGWNSRLPLATPESQTVRSIISGCILYKFWRREDARDKLRGRPDDRSYPARPPVPPARETRSHAESGACSRCRSPRPRHRARSRAAAARRARLEDPPREARLGDALATSASRAPGFVSVGRAAASDYSSALATRLAPRGRAEPRGLGRRGQVPDRGLGGHLERAGRCLEIFSARSRAEPGNAARSGSEVEALRAGRASRARLGDSRGGTRRDENERRRRRRARGAPDDGR